MAKVPPKFPETAFCNCHGTRVDRPIRIRQVTPVPTNQEMLEWAEVTDARIARGELPPLGSNLSSFPGDGAITDQEWAQVGTIGPYLSFNKGTHRCPLPDAMPVTRYSGRS